MPLSILRGRPWPKPGERLFTDDDYDVAMEAHAERKLLCRGCGHPRDETMDPARDLPPGLGGVGEYIAHDSGCASCAAKARREREIAKGGETAPDGRYVWTAFLPYDDGAEALAEG